ncbi:MAG: hypothetical protein HN478_18285 [Rhodospirillaceae bacterium]|jgi:hypothetical protein|nr:hypothetical protein [Rhodospirillaceae bacterium]MBT4490442.1 hypothetical protein [Rhodospirillaceae bacterium]MBT5192352.1 hypothetical protein [Rhodospirillaceae bacterium]MBT5458297.1 hypothetical protein [Rhodospirillaceae bacterium]
MNSLAEIEARLGAMEQDSAPIPTAMADELLELAEQVVCHWLDGMGATPTTAKVEGFRLLALHRQGCKGEPSFNACRESCRELVYHYNLVYLEPDHPKVDTRLAMARAVARHLCLFIDGKLQDRELGDFCCSSQPLRAAAVGTTGHHDELLKGV